MLRFFAVGALVVAERRGVVGGGKEHVAHLKVTTVVA